MSNEPEPRKWVSNQDLQLELKALRSDVKVWILAAVALNQFLAAASLPTSLTGAALLAFLGKGIFTAITARFGGS